jgi:hypothetical protein
MAVECWRRSSGGLVSLLRWPVYPLQRGQMRLFRNRMSSQGLIGTGRRPMYRAAHVMLQPVPVAVVIAAAATLAVIVPYEWSAWPALGLLAGYALSGST